ncbi:MAG: hypothetical protein LBR28_06290 [Bacteroidales bacterium]|nr:hypothetical protein [Bacteroidales bacterium]
MQKIVFFMVAFFIFESNMFAQQTDINKSINNVNHPEVVSDDCSTIIVPQVQKVRNKKGGKTTVVSLNKLEAFVCFETGTAFYNESALNVLDSIYKLAFGKENEHFYKMTIIGYDDAQTLNEQNTNLARERAVLVFNYFLSREDVKDFIIKRTPSKYQSSCAGTVDYFIKYKMPIDFKWINLNGKSVAEQSLNGISLAGKTYILIEDDIESCVGDFYNYYYPQNDTSLNSQYSMITIPKGAVESITNTKDTLEFDYSITYREVMNFEDLMKDYKFIPSEKQYLINAGYIIINTEHKIDYSSCPLRDFIKPTISLKVAVTPEQVNAKLKFFAKVFKSDGSFTYKAIPTKKEKDKNSSNIYLTAEITPFQMDTIYIGKKVEKEELSDYFYPAQQNDPGSFEAMGGWLKAYKLSKKGAYIMKKQMGNMLKKPVGEVELN